MSIFEILLGLFFVASFVNGERRCYVCNSATEPDCGSTDTIKPSSLYQRCEVFAEDFHRGSTLRGLGNRENRGTLELDDRGKTVEKPPLFVIKQGWAENNAAEKYRLVCKKMVIKLPSRDPPGTIYDKEQRINDLRNAMPLRYVRYCGIVPINSPRNVPCSSKIASGKMEVVTCLCESDLCNSSQIVKASVASLISVVSICINFYYRQ